MVDIDAIIRGLRRAPGQHERQPPSIAAVVPATDAPELVDAVPQAAVPVLPILAVMRYRAGDGAVSVRRVRFRAVQVSSAAAACVQCWCYERGASRTFRIDRIEAVTDIDTGEIFDDPLRLAAMFAESGMEEHRSRGRDVTDRVLGRYAAGVTVLAWLARSDGVLHPEEVEVIADYVEERAGMAELDRATITRVARMLMPGPAEFFEALTAASREGPAAMRCLARHAAALIAADGAITEEEFTWAAELRAAMEA